MTIAFADPLDRQDNTDRIRWAVSLLLVLVFHFVAALLLLPREAAVAPNKPPPPAAFLDLAPLPLPGAGGAPGAPPPKPQAPKPNIDQPAPPKPPAREVKPLLPPAPARIPKLAVPLPMAPKPPTPKPQPPKATPAPPLQPPGSAAPVRLDPVRAWQFGVMQRLEKFKKQSVAADFSGEQGVVGLRITIDRQGNILSASIARSSGYDSLDSQALSMARLAGWLPPLPAEIKGDLYWFVVTIEFSIY